MLFPEEDAPLLKTWIVKRIENTSDADSDVLADYVIALLRHDGDKDSVRKLCEQEIPDFLTEDSTQFLNDVFQAIDYKSYRPGAASPLPKPIHLSNEATQNLPTYATLRNPRKRGYEDEDEGEAVDNHDGARVLGRIPKQPRRSRRDPRDNRTQAFPNLPFPPGFIDPNNPLESFMRIQAMGMGMPDLPPLPGSHRRKRRGRCRDFDTKGFCARGSTCMYDHGQESLYVSSTGPQSDEYDPNDALLDMGAIFNPMGFPFSPNSIRGRNRGDKRGRGGRRGISRAAFSADGPVHDRSKSTIVVENIPEESFTEDAIRSFFAQFGHVMEVSMRPYKHLAIVKYDSWSSANAAYQSPKVIFDNRFVKVYWYKEESDNLNGKQVPIAASESGLKINGSATNPDSELNIDPVEFQRKQEVAQKQYEDRERKRLELEQKRKDIEKQQQKLLFKHRAESEKLRVKLAEKNGTGDSGQSAPGGATDMLRAKLAELEQEARILGIDTEASEDAGDLSSLRGDHRGRGRGYRGRGGLTPRVRGSFRGTGRHATYAQFSLDNRPRKIALRGVDFTVPEKDEALRYFLLNMGEYEAVETASDVTHVSFKQRKTAETFYQSLNNKELPGLNEKLELTWVNNSVSPSVPATNTMSSASEPDQGKAGHATGISSIEGEGDSGISSGVKDDATKTLPKQLHANQDEHRREVDMDYEMPEDDAW